MPNDAISPYHSSDLDAGDELEALGLDEARWFLDQLRTVLLGWPRGRNLAWFMEFKGVPVCKMDRGTDFIAYVVDIEDDDSVVITLLCADRIARFAVEQFFPDNWDKAALAGLKAHLWPRLEDFFDDDAV